MLSEIHKKNIWIIFCCILAIGGIYLFFQYLFSVLLPFFIAWFIAFLLQKPINFLKNNCGISKKISAPFLVFIFTFTIFILLYFLAERICRELLVFLQNALFFFEKLRNDDKLAQEWIAKINGFVPFFDVSSLLTNLWENLDTSLKNLAISLISKLTGSILPIIGDLVAFLPGALLYLCVIIISCYYFAVDFENINKFIITIIPDAIKKPLERVKTAIFETAGKFLKAYLLLMLITFSELFVFFAVIRVKYAFLIALIIAVIDFIPLVGTGIVLIPWGVAAIIGGDTARGIAILAMFGVESVVRQIIEPKIMGKYMNLNPLLMLIAMYAGMRFMGAFGLIIFPLAFAVLQNLLKNRKKAVEMQDCEKS